MSPSSIANKLGPFSTKLPDNKTVAAKAEENPKFIVRVFDGDLCETK
jgi:hypothetical protein